MTSFALAERWDGIDFATPLELELGQARGQVAVPTHDFSEDWLASLFPSRPGASRAHDIRAEALTRIYSGTWKRWADETRDEFLARVCRSVGASEKRSRSREQQRHRLAFPERRVVLPTRLEKLQDRDLKPDALDLFADSPERAATREQFQAQLSEEQAEVLAAREIGRGTKTRLSRRAQERALAELRDLSKNLS